MMFADTPLHMIEDDESLAALVEKLRTRDVIGVDTEADSFHHYQEKLCLVQISDLEADYIVDPLKVTDLTPLKSVLEDPDIVIILHGGDYDVVSLKRDFGIHINNIFDTMIAGQFLGLPRIGLADLIGRYFGHTIDKKYQRHDWARRPLEPEHLAYARGDTHWLLALREVMSRRLTQKKRLEAHREECEWLAKRSWSGRTNTDGDFHRVKGSNKLDEGALRVLRAVWTYRDEQARSMDRPSFKVLPGPVLIQLAVKKPTSQDALAKVMRPGSSMHRKHGAALLKAVKAGLADERELPPVPKKASAAREPLPPSSPGAPGVDRLFGPLKDWRNRVVGAKGLPPVVVANNSVLKDVAKVAPRTLQDLADILGVLRWQVKSSRRDFE